MAVQESTTMRRVHFLELHEQPWYPSSWRDLFQRSLGQATSRLGVFQNVADPFQRFLKRLRPASVLDLCTGSGELAVSIWKGVTSSLDSAERPVLVLSDLYPNVAAYARLKEHNSGTIDYLKDPVNVLDPPEGAPRVWTMFESLHHFRPEQAKKILQSAADNAEGIAVFEATSRSIRTILQVLLTMPLLSTYFTLKTEPVRFRNFLWGLLLPVVPLTSVFDAVVSNLRTYSVEELKAMTRSIDNPEFKWKVDTVDIPGSGGLKVTYLFGWNVNGISAKANR